MSRDSFFVPAAGCFRGRVTCGDWAVSVAESAHPAFPVRGIMLQPLGCRDYLRLTFCLHRFSSLGLKSGIDARIALVLAFWLHRFASLGLKSRIDARIALVLTSLLHRFASLSLKSRIDAVLSCRRVEWPACSSRSRIDAVSDSNFRCLKEE